MRSFIITLVLLGSAREAAAQDAAWATAHFECLSGNTVITAKTKKPKLDVELGCIVVVDSGSVDGGWARMWVTQDGLAEVPHERNGDLLAEDGKAYFQFGLFQRLDDYLPCKPFELHAAIFTGDSDMTYTAWEGKLTVKGTCKKPKKIKASLRCSSVAQDGTTYVFPGNGAKVKPRLEEALTCTVTGKKKSGKPLGTFTVTTPRGARTSPMSTLEDLKPYAELALMPDADFDTCASFTVRGSVTNDVGQVVWTGKQKIAQDCPD